MIRILLIRHGNTEPLGRMLYGRMPGIHLNEEGYRQAHTVARILRQRYVLKEVVTSPMERARQTAEPIAEAQGLVVNVQEGWNEIDFGSWTGKTFEELQERDDWARYNETRSRVWPPGGESMMDVQSRAARALAELSVRYERDSEATVAVISHGDVVRGLLLLLLGMPLDHIHRLEVAPGSVSEVLLNAGDARVIHVNQIF